MKLKLSFRKIDVCKFFFSILENDDLSWKPRIMAAAGNLYVFLEMLNNSLSYFGCLGN